MKSRTYLIATVAFLCLIAASPSFAQVACVPGGNYLATTGAGAIVPGTVNTGSFCDDCTVNVTVPFPVRIYDQPAVTSLELSSNGTTQFSGANASFVNVCLPDGGHSTTVFGFWDDLRTDGAGCAGGCGIFTSVSGVAPNRIYNIEWRTTYFGAPGFANFEVRLHEANALFEVVLGALDVANSATLGVQELDGSGGMFTQFACDTPVTQNQQITYTCTLVPVELMGFSIQ